MTNQGLKAALFEAIIPLLVVTVAVMQFTFTDSSFKSETQVGTVQEVPVPVVVDTGRHMDSKLEAFLHQNLKEDSKVQVLINLGDSEAGQFAAEVYTFLVNNGWETVSPGLTQFDPPISGIQINEGDDVTQLKIGSQQ